MCPVHQVHWEKFSFVFVCVSGRQNWTKMKFFFFFFFRIWRVEFLHFSWDLFEFANDFSKQKGKTGLKKGRKNVPNLFSRTPCFANELRLRTAGRSQQRRAVTTTTTTPPARERGHEMTIRNRFFFLFLLPSSPFFFFFFFFF